MHTIAFINLGWIDAHPDATAENKALAVDYVPADQWATPDGHWRELSQYCRNRIQPATERRSGTRLNIEVSQPLARCLERSPDGFGARYYLSGGSALTYGVCQQAHCWQCQKGAQ